MKICIVTTMFPKYEGDYYGTFVFEEAKALVDNGFEVHVVTPHNEGALYNEIWDGIHIHRFKWFEPRPFKALVHFKGLKDNIRFVTYLFSLFFSLLKVLKDYKIELLHAHSTLPTGLIAAVVTKFIRIPFFITAHGMDINEFESSYIFRHLISFSLNSSDKTIAVSQDLARKMVLMHVDESRITVLRNAVDKRRFTPQENMKIRWDYGINEKTILILFVGYLDTFKGIFELINAFGEIKKHYDDIKLMMVGTGPKKLQLKKRISKLGLESSVIFTGKVAPFDVNQYYKSADIFVLPSYGEGGGPPLVVIEAMACGLPVVVSDVGGIPEIIKDGVNGFIVPPRNEEKLIQKLNILIENEEMRNKFRQKSIDTIDSEFDIDKKVRKLIKLYKACFR